MLIVMEVMDLTLEEAIEEIRDHAIVIDFRPRKAIEALRILYKALNEYKSSCEVKCTINKSDVANCDKFICRECGICLQDWVRVVPVEYDDGYIDYEHHEYEFEFCPNCGRKIVEEGSDA